MRPFSIIAAFDSKYGIGKNGQLAWNLPSDLKHFKEITTAVAHPAKQNAVIMGRKTWDSLPAKFKPLPGRINLVLSRQGNLNLPPGVLSAANLDGALKILVRPDIEHVFVIGGGQIYAEAMKHSLCHNLYITHVEGDFGCDTFFPAISQQFFPVSASEPATENGTHFHFSEYLRYT